MVAMVTIFSLVVVVARQHSFLYTGWLPRSPSRVRNRGAVRFIDTACSGCFSQMPRSITWRLSGTETSVSGRPKPGEKKGGVLRGSEEHTSELQSPCNLVCRLLLEKKNKP